MDAPDIRIEDVAYEQLPESVQRLINALDATSLCLLPAQQQVKIEYAIRAVLRDPKLTGMVEV